MGTRWVHSAQLRLRQARHGTLCHTRIYGSRPRRRDNIRVALSSRQANLGTTGLWKQPAQAAQLDVQRVFIPTPQHMVHLIRQRGRIRNNNTGFSRAQACCVECIRHNKSQTSSHVIYCRSLWRLASPRRLPASTAGGWRLGKCLAVAISAAGWHLGGRGWPAPCRLRRRHSKACLGGLRRARLINDGHGHAAREYSRRRARTLSLSRSLFHTHPHPHATMAPQEAGHAYM